MVRVIESDFIFVLSSVPIKHIFRKNTSLQVG